MGDNTRVLCVMPTQDRPAFALRAVYQFKRQTYKTRRLLIINSGKDWLDTPDSMGIDQVHTQHGLTGLASMIRNHQEALKHGAMAAAELIVFWEDDDHNHPRRLEEHVCNMGSGAIAHGAPFTHYYNINTAKWWFGKHPRRASLFTTAVRADWYRANGFPDTKYPDVDLWKRFGSNVVLNGDPENPMGIGIKYSHLPRVGIGHKMCLTPDSGFEWLRSKIGSADCKFYQEMGA